MSSNEDLVGRFIHQVKTEKKVTPPVASRKKRIFIGLFLGAMTAAVYSILAEVINLIQAPGTPLYFHPFGTIGNIFYAMVLGCLIGIASSWSEKATSGIGLGSLILFIGLEIRQFFSLSFPFSMLVFTTFSFFALIAVAFEIAVLMVLVGILRWAVDVQLEKPILNWQRLLPVALLIGIAVFVGYLHKLPQEQIFALRMTNNLVQEGIKAEEYSQLPDALKDDQRIGDFFAYATSNYKLENNDFISSVFYDAYPGLEIFTYDHIVVIYFESGQDMACLISPGRDPKCVPIFWKK